MRRWIFAILAWFVASVAPGAAQTIPPMTATDLNKRELRIPDDLTGSPVVLLIAFEREQQRDIDRLTPLFEKAKAAYPKLMVWEIPAISNPGAIGRFAIDTGMRAGVPNEKTRAGVVTLYVEDRKTWARTLGLPEVQDVYAAVLGEGGKVVLWKSEKELANQSDVDAFLSAAMKTGNAKS